MKFTLAAVALASVAAAASLDDIPTCAKSCLDDSIKSKTDCTTTDVSCICKSFDTIQTDATPCVIKACGDKVGDVISAAQALCADGGSDSGDGDDSTTAAAAPSTSAVKTMTTEEVVPTSATVEKTMTSAVMTSAVMTSAAESDCSGMTTVKPTGTGAPAPGNGTSTMSMPTAGAAMMGSMGAVAMGALAALAL